MGVDRYTIGSKTKRTKKKRFGAIALVKSNSKGLHKGLRPRYEKMEWRSDGITLLPNLNVPIQKKELLIESNLQACSGSNLESI